MAEVLQRSPDRNTKIKAILDHFGVNMKGLAGNDLTYENAVDLYNMDQEQIEILEKIRDLKGKQKAQFIDNVIQDLNIKVPSRAGSRSGSTKTTADSSPDITPLNSDHGGKWWKILDKKREFSAH